MIPYAYKLTRRIVPCAGRLIPAACRPGFISSVITVMSAALLISAAFCHAGVKVSAEVDKTEVRIAERIIYTLHIEIDHDTSAVLPVDRPDFTPFDLLGMQAVDKVEDEEKTFYSLSYVIAAYETGELKIPALPVYYTGPEGEEKEALPDTIIVRVNATVPVTEVDIRDIKAPQFEGQSEARGILLPVAGALAILVVLVSGIYLYSRRGREGKAAASDIEPMITILDELEAIDRASFDDMREYYRKVSELVNGYVLDGASVPEAGLTRSDFLDVIKSTKSGESLEQIDGFVSDSYMVRFARYSPTDDEADEFLEEAKRIVSRG